MAVSDYSATPADNTLIEGISVSDATRVNAVDDVMRQIMADIASARGNGELLKRPTTPELSADYSPTLDDVGGVLRFTADASLFLPAAAVAQAGWYIMVKADGGDVTIEPNGVETVDGLTSAILRDGQTIAIYSTGTEFLTTGNGVLDQSSYVRTTSGAAGAYVISPELSVESYLDGMRFSGIAHQAAQSGQTFDAGAGAVVMRRSIFGLGLVDVNARDISTDDHFEVTYDSSGPHFLLTAILPNVATESRNGFVRRATLADVMAKTDFVWPAAPQVHEMVHGSPTTINLSVTNQVAIPANASRISVHLDEVSLSGGNDILVQLSVSGVFIEDGYSGISGVLGTGNPVTNTGGFVMYFSNPGVVRTGRMEITKSPTANNWTQDHNLFGALGGGGVVLAGAVDAVRVIPSGGNTITGSVTVSYS